ncbi:MAG: ATP-binding protein, partial [Bacteroidota bacterium]
LELRDAMVGLPDTPWDTIPTMLRGQLPKPTSDKDWTTSLQAISLTMHNALGRVTGEGMVDEFYRKAYDRLADHYKALRSFPVVIGMIPDHLIDESKIGMLNRSQVEDVLFEKVEDLQKVNQWVMEKNHELEEARKDLMAAKEEVVQSANHITTILESVGEGIITVNESGHITVVNSEVSAIWGYRKAELAGKSIGLLIPELELPAQAADNGSLPADEAAAEKQVEMVGRRNNGEYFPVEVTVSHTTFGQEKLRVFVARDITSRKQDELRTRELMTELKSANGELQEYAHVVSHDLKAPLRGIGTLANWIRDDYGELLGPEGKEHCDQMVLRVQRTYRLIDAILDYSKVGRNANQDTSFDLHEVVEEVFHVLHPPEHITFRTCQRLPSMVADKTRIRQVFQNLLGNAMTAIDKAEGKIEVDFQIRDQALEFSISDNGMGIDERHFKKIFDIFQSLQSSNNPESTGIGLSIVKKVVELYKGKIWLESTPGEGTTFYMAWPIQLFPEHAPSSGVPVAQEPDA